MADESLGEGTSFGPINCEISESTVEVNIKTLDSQIHTFRVDKNMSVSSFKEKIASAISVPVGQQRLIFRGTVLKDDQLLSEYHLEDGHTLHLVVRQPVQSQTSPATSIAQTDGNNDNRGNDPTAGMPRNRIGQVSHGVLLGTFNVGDQNEGIVPDLSRIIGAVLNSVGIGNLMTAGGASNTSSMTPPNGPNQTPQGVETAGIGGSSAGHSWTGTEAQSGQGFLNHPFQALHQSLQFPWTGPVAVPSHPVDIPDSLTTISDFISRMEQVLSADGNQSSASPVGTGSSPSPSIRPNIQALPTAEALVPVLLRSQHLLSGHAGAALSNIAGLLEREGPTFDPATQSQIQAEAMQVGVAMQHLGALFLELGRTILMLRMGQSPGESLVNAGPAVYISPSGPNPIMVQPSLQSSPPFGISSAAPRGNTGISGPIGLGDVPRNINIHIHAGTSVAGGASSIGSRVNAGEGTNVPQPSVQAQVSLSGANSVEPDPTRVLPVRNVIAAVPGRSPVEAASHVLSVLSPLNARAQLANPSHSASAQGSSLAIPQGGGQPIIGGFVSEPTVQLSNRSVDGITQAADSYGPTLETATVLNADPSESFPSKNSSDSACNDDGKRRLGSTAPHELRHISEADHASGNEGHQAQSDKIQFRNSEDAIINLNKAEALTSSVADSTSCSSKIEANSSRPEDQYERSSQDQEASVSSKSIPLGLGSGGLQPKRRSRQGKDRLVKFQKEDTVTGNGPAISQSQPSVAVGQQVLQSLASRASNMNRSDAGGLSMQLPPVFSQIMNSLPLGGQAVNEQVDAASMMSQLLQNPALNNLLAGMSEQAGVGSPAGLRSILEEVTQSPSMRNTLNDIAQQIEGQDLGGMFSGMGGGQGSFDFSSMVQQLMPVVSQALGRASNFPASIHGIQPEPHPLLNNGMGRDDEVDIGNSQVDPQLFVQSIERHDPPGSVFRMVVENVSHLRGEGNASEDLIEEICKDDNLTTEFMEMLQRDLHRRLQSEKS